MFEDKSDNDSDLPRKRYLYSPENLGDQTPTLIPLFGVQSSLVSDQPENDKQYFGFLPPRHRRPRCQQADTTAGTQPLTILGDTISFPIPSHSVSEQDVQDTITRMGFKEHVITNVSLQRENCLASVQFSQTHLANTAFSLFRQNCASGIWISPNGPAVASTSKQRGLTVDRKEIDASDLAREPDAGKHEAPSVDHCDIYKGLNKAIYEEDDCDLTSPERSPSNSPIPLTDVSEQISSDVPSDIELSYLNCPARELPHCSNASGQIGRVRNRTQPSSFQQSPHQLPVHQVAQPGIHVVGVPKSAYNQARRVLVPNADKLPLVTVSMRADLQFFHRTKSYRLSKYSRPNNDVYRHVVDAAIIAETTIVAYGDGPVQISVLRLSEDQPPSFTDLSGITPHQRTDSAPNKLGNIAVSCLATHSSIQQTIQFFTGGYDKTLRLWSVDARDPASATSREVTKLSTIPEALACRRRRRSLLAATSRKFMEIDIDHLSRKPASFQTSNVIHQIHVHNEAPNVTILEVDNLDFQIQIYDDRKGGFDRTPDCYFGGRYGAPVKSSKGDTHLSLFAKGYEDGTVCVWDYRNGKRPFVSKRHHGIGSVIHTTFMTMDFLVCYGKRGLTFLDISTDYD